MILSIFTIGNLHLPIVGIFFILGVFLAAFLFWRAGKNELIESEVLFDFILVAGVGAFIFARIFDFLTQSDLYNWSFYRFLFFNVWGGFNFYGALFGIALFGSIFLKRKKSNPWYFFDLMVAPLLFAQVLIALGIFLNRSYSEQNFLFSYHPSLYYFWGYFVLFWIVKRLSIQKRHVGFFASFYLVTVTSLDLFLRSLSNFETISKMGMNNLFINFQFTLPLFFLLIGSISWYILAKRSFFNDLKSFFAIVLLAILKTKRILTSTIEANEFSKILILLPYFIIKAVYNLIKFLIKEIILGIADFMQTLGIRK